MRESQSDQRERHFSAEREATQGTQVPFSFLICRVVRVVNILRHSFRTDIPRRADEITTSP